MISLLFLGQILTAQLVDNGDGTITDHKTGLMWLDTISKDGQMNWDNAMDWASDLDYAGHTDWHLPAGETWTIYGDIGSIWWGYSQPPDGLPFNNLPYACYLWTSNESEDEETEAYQYYWADPALNTAPKSAILDVWAVREIQDFTSEIVVDVWIKDYDSDERLEPSSRSGESVDIYIDNDNDGHIDYPVGWWNTTAGWHDSKVKAYIRNYSDAYVSADVYLYLWNCETEGMFNNEDLAEISNSQSIIIDPYSRSLVDFTIVSLPNVMAGGRDYCLGIKVNNDNDPVPDLPIDPTLDNNIATAKLHSIAEREGDDASLEWKWYPWWFKPGMLILAAVLIALTLEHYLLRKHFKKKYEG